MNWFESYPSDLFSNIIYDVPTSAAMLIDVGDATQLDAGYVYITDQTVPNPYDQLPSYWDQEVAALVSLPEPATMPLMVLGGAVLLVAVVFGRSFVLES